MDVEDQFDALASEVSWKASGIQCSVQEYRDGLQYIIGILTTDIIASLETDGG